MIEEPQLTTEQWLHEICCYAGWGNRGECVRTDDGWVGTAELMTIRDAIISILIGRRCGDTIHLPDEHVPAYLRIPYSDVEIQELRAKAQRLIDPTNMSPEYMAGFEDSATLNARKQLAKLRI